MSHHALLLLPLLAPFVAPVQEDAAPSPWKPVDFVVVQVGDEMITWSDVEHTTGLEVARRKLSITTLADLNRVRGQTLDDLVLMKLESQAAEDSEESPAETEDRVERWLEQGRRDQSAVEYTEELQESGFTPHSYQEQQVSHYRTSAFRNQGLFGPRPTRDAYIRPGETRELYRIQGQEVLGGGATYRFQDLVVTAEQVGGVEQARALADELRQRLSDGEDFAALHDEYGTTEIDTGGVTRLFGPDKPMPDPAIRRFAEENEVGAISPVYPVLDPRRGEVAGFRILRLYELTPGSPPPPFAEAGTQARIREIAVKNRREIWLGVSRAGLDERSFIWLNDNAASRTPTEAGAGAAPAAGPR